MNCINLFVNTQSIVKTNKIPFVTRNKIKTFCFIYFFNFCTNTVYQFIFRHTGNHQWFLFTWTMRIERNQRMQRKTLNNEVGEKHFSRHSLMSWIKFISKYRLRKIWQLSEAAFQTNVKDIQLWWKNVLMQVWDWDEYKHI